MASPSLDAGLIPNRAPVYRAAAIWCGVAVGAVLIALVLTRTPLRDAATIDTTVGAALVLFFWATILVWFLSDIVALILAIVAIARARDRRSRAIAIVIAIVCVVLIRVSGLVLEQP